MNYIKQYTNFKLPNLDFGELSIIKTFSTTDQDNAVNSPAFYPEDKRGTVLYNIN